MTASPFVNQVLCAVAAFGVALASYQSASVSAPPSARAAARVEAPATQTVNRTAKGDKLKILPHADPDKPTTPGGRGAPVTIASRYEVVAATLANVDPSISDLLFTLLILPELNLITTDGEQS
jgi:hypothetical protein